MLRTTLRSNIDNTNIRKSKGASADYNKKLSPSWGIFEVRKASNHWSHYNRCFRLFSEKLTLIPTHVSTCCLAKWEYLQWISTCHTFIPLFPNPFFPLSIFRSLYFSLPQFFAPSIFRSLYFSLPLFFAPSIFHFLYFSCTKLCP